MWNVCGTCVERVVEHFLVVQNGTNAVYIYVYNKTNALCLSNKAELNSADCL